MVRHNRGDLTDDVPIVDVHECKSRTARERATTLAEEMIRSLYYLPSGPGDWEDCVDAAVQFVNDHGGGTEATASVDEVLPVVAKRSHIHYWDFE